MLRHFLSALIVSCFAAVCPGCDGAVPPVEGISGFGRVECGELAPNAVDESEAEEFARVIQLEHDAKILKHLDARPELVCAQLALDTLPPAGWKSWRRTRVVEKVGVAGFVAARRSRSQALLAALFERGAPHARVLGLAARTGRNALVAWLLERGVDPASGDALLEAVAAQHLRSVQALLAAGADPDQPPSPDSPLAEGDPSPLFFAIYTRRPDIAEALLDAGAAADYETTWGRPDEAATLLEWAIFMKLWPLTARLVEEGANPRGLPYYERQKLGGAARTYRLETVLAALGY